jgi:hypothetical protein
MAKAQVCRTRITIEVDPVVQQKIAQWAVSEGRPVSNLLRRVLSELVDQRTAVRGAAASRPIQKQLTV